jgi:hypothetical protein
MSRPVIKYKVARPWSASDDEELRRRLLAGEMPEDIAKPIQRSVAAVRLRAIHLKLSVSRNLALRAARNEKRATKAAGNI